MKSNYCPVTGKKFDCKACEIPSKNKGFCPYMEWDVFAERTFSFFRKWAKDELNEKKDSIG